MDLKNKTIILGASGLIGNYIYKIMKEKGNPVIGTYCTNKKEDLVYLDISKPNFNNIPIKEIKSMIICSSITKLERCKEEEEFSNKINVTSLENMLEFCEKNDIFPIYFSSASVFDGVIGNYTENDKKNPTTLYGLQKAKVEDFISRNLNKYLIIRPGKIFGTKKGEGVLFSEWLEKYKAGEKIFCADDENLSPTFVEDIAKATILLNKSNSRGIYHINYPEHYSRLEMAKKFFDYLQINDAKIIRCSIDDFNFLEKRNKNTYLNSDKFMNEFDFKFTELNKCFELINSKVTWRR